jgi:hypothetical protein
MERARNSQLCVTCHFQIFIVHCVYLHKNDYFIRHRFRPIVRLYFFDYSDNSIIRQVNRFLRCFQSYRPLQIRIFFVAQ